MIGQANAMNHAGWWMVVLPAQIRSRRAWGRSRTQPSLRQRPGAFETRVSMGWKDLGAYCAKLEIVLDAHSGFG